jgi:hypothetical protein
MSCLLWRVNLGPRSGARLAGRLTVLSPTVDGERKRARPTAGASKAAESQKRVPGEAGQLTAAGIPLWESAGLPDGIREKDLEDAAVFLRYRSLPASSRLISAYGPPGTGGYCRLYGTRYEHNAKRMEALRDLPSIPNGWDRQDRYIVLTYPALLLPDPSPLEPGNAARPVAVCSHTGYVGSAWDEPATALRPHVDAARDQGAYLVTSLRVLEDTAGTIPLCWNLSVWLPHPTPQSEPIAELNGWVPMGAKATGTWPKDS